MRKYSRMVFFGLMALLPAMVLAQVPALSIGGNSDKPIKISADNLEVLQKDQIAVFSGNVIAVQGEVTIKADEMKVYYRGNTDPKKQDNTSISRIDVNGHVFLTQPDETAQGETGVYDVDKSMIKLNGNIILTKNKNILKGDRLEYNMKTGKSQVFSNTGAGKKARVEGLFVPDRKTQGK